MILLKLRWFAFGFTTMTAFIVWKTLLSHLPKYYVSDGAIILIVWAVYGMVAFGCRDPIAGAFIVANGDQTRFRAWGDFGPIWIDSKKDALHFARRSDAEAFAKEDEDAWFILPVQVPE